MRWIILIIISFTLLVQGAAVVSASVSSHYQAVSARLVADAENYLSNEDAENALLFYRRAMVANPRNINSYLGLGGLHASIGQYALGVKYYDIALSIDPIDLVALEGRVMANLKKNDFTSADESFQTMQQVCKIITCEQLLKVSEAMQAYKLAEDVK